MGEDWSALQKCLFFQEKSAEEIAALMGTIQTRTRKCTRGEVIVTEGEPALHLGIVLSGQVEVQKIHPTGNNITITRMAAGHTFGEAVLFSRGKIYPATVVASEASRVLLIGKAELLELFAADTDILSRFMENLSERLVLLNRKIEILSLGSLRRRIASYLLKETAQRHSDRFTLPFTKKVWAEHLNTTRPSLSREIGYMQEQGWISFSGNTFIICDRDMLESQLR
ncbi:Crp/Fnr family transcriptional regulator [Gorillibacterium massiliense]|uniref:Crp/Fnr family transcriptional regulator n=1 Tax=Gorillibacterium massiliense TaxID=1280390 RepID=UPI0004B6E29C|nr:Crp/Fnr family transcriptional regulator [Gorillibacterium massiliense]